MDRSGPNELVGLVQIKPAAYDLLQNVKDDTLQGAPVSLSRGCLKLRASFPTPFEAHHHPIHLSARHLADWCFSEG
jgi:hypothetical protein